MVQSHVNSSKEVLETIANVRVQLVLRMLKDTPQNVSGLPPGGYLANLDVYSCMLAAAVLFVFHNDEASADDFFPLVGAAFAVATELRSRTLDKHGAESLSDLEAVFRKHFN